MFKPLKIFLLVTTLAFCEVSGSMKEVPLAGRLELRRGDILVKPNHNWLPGSSTVQGGYGFGHVAIVIEGASGDEPEEVLRQTVIFESVARDIDGTYQLRKAFAFDDTTDPRKKNTNFSNLHTGYRYVLRPAIEETLQDSIINWVMSKDGGLSSWRALKNQDSGESKKYWYCSLLIWQAYHDILGADLDINGGQVVYPNDIINSDYFTGNGASRFRF